MYSLEEKVLYLFLLTWINYFVKDAFSVSVLEYCGKFCCAYVDFGQRFNVPNFSYIWQWMKLGKV